MKSFLKKSAFLLLALALIFSMVACGATDDETDGDAAPKDDAKKKEKEVVFSIVWNGTTIELGKSATSVLTALGDPNSSQEVFDCGEGNSRMRYQYASFELYTMKSDGQEVIDQIEVLDDLCETGAKIAIGSSESAVRDAYGTPSKEEDGTLIYTSGNKHLILDVENGTVTGIGLLRKTN